MIATTAPIAVTPAHGVIYSGDCIATMRAWPDAIFDAVHHRIRRTT